jgi:hypothetical protein
MERVWHIITPSPPTPLPQGEGGKKSGKVICDGRTPSHVTFPEGRRMGRGWRKDAGGTGDA